MLQWMGGSRRKVKTSRKSIQNRQHQYFQQRKRQQRAELLEQNVDDSATMSQNIQESKSLDVASLMNISLAAYATGVSNKEKGFMQRKADSKNEQTRDHVHTTCAAGVNTEHYPAQNASFKADAETQWTPSSATEAAKASGHTKLFSTNFHESSQRAKHEELKEQNSKGNHPPKRFSVLDIISDSSEGSYQKLSPLEAYVSFAIKGAGKMKDKTPDNFEHIKGSSAFERVEKMEFDLPTMPVDASLLTPESQFGWKDENHQKGIVPEKISISNNFMAPSGSHKEHVYSLNDSEFQENLYIFSCNESSQKDGPLIDLSPSPTNSNTIYDNHLRASNFASARHVMDAASNLLNGEGNSYCSHVPFFKEVEPKEKGCRFTEDDIQVTFLDLSEKQSSFSNTHNHGVYEIVNLRNNVNVFASYLDCSSSSTFNPHFTTNFGTKNGHDSWDEFRTDESYSTSIGNISWLHDHPADRNCLPFDGMTKHLAKFMSLRTENDYGINISSGDGSEVKCSRIMSPVLPTFYTQTSCEMQEDNILQQFSMSSSKNPSGDSLTSPYLEEISVMPEKSDGSIMESYSQRKMEVTADSTDRQCTNDKRAPMVMSLFNSANKYRATFHTNVHTAAKASCEKSKSSVSGKLDPTKEGNKSASSSLHRINRKEQKKSHRNDFIENQDKRIKRNAYSSKNLDKASRSMDKDNIVICEHEGLQILATPHLKEISVDSKHKTFNLQIESSFKCVHNQDDIQLTETRNNIDEIHHLELKQTQTKERKTQDTHLVFEDIKPMSPETKPNAQPETEREDDRKTLGKSKESYVNKQSLIDISEVNNEKLEPQENKSMVDTRVAMEYEGMLESYILQLRCMYKALQHTLDQELYDKGNGI